MSSAHGDIALAVDRDDCFLDVEALWRGRRVGYAWCSIQDDGRLLLCDLKVDDRLHVPYPFAHWLLISMGIRCRTRSFRRQGIGRLLMQRLLAEVREAGIRGIWGSVTQADIDRTPYLLDWYRRLGFTVTAPDEECIDTAAKKIVMMLAAGHGCALPGTSETAVPTPTPCPAIADRQSGSGVDEDQDEGGGHRSAISTHTETLKQLARELLSREESAQLDKVIADGAIDFDALVQLDESLGWACMSNVTIGTKGNYAIEDRDVFRPLQYCRGYFVMMSNGSPAEWLTREIVHMASLHIESLASRIALVNRSPLGRTIREKVFRQQVDVTTWGLLDRFRHVFNAAKHDMMHPKDTHLFSEQDAVLAYFVCRAIGIRLRHLAKLSTDFVA